MPYFTYIALDAEQKTITGKTEQPTRAAVIEALAKQGLRPISIKEAKSSKINLNFSLNSLLQPNKVKSTNLVIFTRQLSTMIGAGVPLLRSLTSLEKHAEDPALKKILGSIIRDVESGALLGNALAKYPETFSEIYVNMVRAGEAAGILDDILNRLAFQQEKSASIRKKIRSAMTYPTVLIIITILAFFGLMLFVVPQIGNIIQDLSAPGTELPGITLAMLAISDFVINFWFIIIPGLATLFYLFLRYIKTPSGRKYYDTVLLNIPGVKTLIKKIVLARFSRVFSALMEAGVAVLEALDITSRAVGNSLYEESLKKAATEVKNGRSLSSIIARDPLFPAIIAQMLAVGEETGQTDKVLVKVADFYEEEVDVAVEGLSSIIEPVMIAFLGGMVGLIAASVMIPISQLSQNIR